MRRILIIGLLLLAVQAKAQMDWPKLLDSLHVLLNAGKLSAKEQLGAYDMLERYYSGRNLDSTYAYGVKGLELARSTHNKVMEAYFVGYVGGKYAFTGKYDSAFYYQRVQIDLANETQNWPLQQLAYFGLANLYARQGRFALAVENYQKSIDFYHDHLFKSAELDDIIADLTQSIHHYSPLRTKLLSLANAGECYRRLNNTEMALAYLTKAKVHLEQYQKALGMDITAYAQVNRELGYVFYMRGELDKALEMQLEVLKIETLPIIVQSDCKEALAKIYIAKGEYTKAEQCARECLELARQLGDPYIDVLAWNLLAESYRAQHRYRDCEAAASKAWGMDSISVDTAPISAANLAYANLHLGNANKAEYFFKQRDKLIEEKSSKDFQDGLADMEVKYETDKKEQRITALEHERQLYLWLAAAGVLLLFALGGVLWLKIRNARKERQLIATQSILDGEMRERSRLAHDLHDRLSGNLSALKMKMGQINEPLQEVSQKLDGCIDEVRRVAHNLMPVSLRQGMKVALNDFAAQFPKVQFHFFGKEERLEERAEFVVYCCANELVNNALKHAGANNIHLQLVQDKEHVSLTVQDDGCGFDTKTETKGMGLQSVRDRVRSYNGRMEMDSQPGQGTEITIILKCGKK